MTTFEHAMIGIAGTLAAGLHRRFGWRIAAAAGWAAISPDWDGLLLVGGPAWFDRAHRVWGHNLFVCPTVGAAIALLDLRWDLSGRGRRWLDRCLRQPPVEDPPLPATKATWLVFALVGALAALSHLPADLVYSGSATLGDWELKLLWPLSQRGFVYALVRWGDVGASVIFAAGMFAMVRWPRRVQLLAGLTLAAVIAYIVICGAGRTMF